MTRRDRPSAASASARVFVWLVCVLHAVAGTRPARNGGERMTSVRDEELVAIAPIAAGDALILGDNVEPRAAFLARAAAAEIRHAHPYGLDHPTWKAPTGFRFDTAEDAFAAIDAAYGPDSGHIVVGPVPRP